MRLLVQFQTIWKNFGARIAVAGANLSGPEGEIFGVFGHTGASKRTALGMLLFP